jgi:hypothetical protein
LCFYRDYGYYLHLTRSHVDNIQREIDGVKKNTTGGKGRRFKEWVGDITRDLNERTQKTYDLVRTMERAQPRDPLSILVIGRMFRSLRRKYKLGIEN